jgi:hypothetical protein
MVGAEQRGCHLEVGKRTWLRAEQGDCQLEVGRRAPRWDSLCPRRGTLEESHTAVNQHSH